MADYPMQPIVLVDGVARFKANPIVRKLLETSTLDLNTIAMMDFEPEDHEQLAQLLGYSVSGFGDLSYAKRSTVIRADAEAVILSIDREYRRG